jgi:mRNA interferase RelE/StbE/toxin YoeB
MPFRFDFSDGLRKKLDKLAKKDPHRTGLLQKKLAEIVNSDDTAIGHYKNLRYGLSSLKRVHVNSSFVLTFEVDRKRHFIVFMDFDHHDRIYER